MTGNGKTLANPIGTATGSPSSDPSTITTALQTVLGKGPDPETGSSYGFSGVTNREYGQNCSGVDNQEGYTDCPDALNFGAYYKNNVLPYTINYALNVQWQPTNDLAITIGYSGNRGRHSVIPIPFNEPGIATPTNPIHGETNSYGFEVLNATSSAKWIRLRSDPERAMELGRRRQYGFPRAVYRVQPQCGSLQNGGRIGL